MTTNGPQAPLYFDDLLEGTTVLSPARTVTEADVVAFAGLSGDYNPLHVDAEAAARSTFGRRVAHGMLGASIASGLFTKTWLSIQLQESLVALLDLQWRFAAPIFIGDTIHLEATITTLRDTKDPARGIATLKRVVHNQGGTIVQSGTTQMLVRRRPPVVLNGHPAARPDDTTISQGR